MDHTAVAETAVHFGELRLYNGFSAANAANAAATARAADETAAEAAVAAADAAVAADEAAAAATEAAKAAAVYNSAMSSGSRSSSSSGNTSNSGLGGKKRLADKKAEAAACADEFAKNASAKAAAAAARAAAAAAARAAAAAAAAAAEHADAAAGSVSSNHVFPEFWDKGIAKRLECMPHGLVGQDDFDSSGIEICNTTLGSGGYGKVYPCRIQSKEYAIKIPKCILWKRGTSLPENAWMPFSTFLRHADTGTDSSLKTECSNAEKVFEPSFLRLIRLHKHTKKTNQVDGPYAALRGVAAQLERVGKKLPLLSKDEYSWLAASMRRLMDHPGYAHIHHIYHFDPTVPCIISQRANGCLYSMQRTIRHERDDGRPHDTCLDPIAHTGSPLLMLSPVCSRIALQLGEALLFMHEESSIMLFDIKPGNVLYSLPPSSSPSGSATAGRGGAAGGHQREMNKIHCMLSDFGICSGNKELMISSLYLVDHGTPYYNPINGYSMGWEEDDAGYMPFELAIFQYIATIVDMICFPSSHAGIMPAGWHNFCVSNIEIPDFPTIEAVVRGKLRGLFAEDAVSMANVSVSVAELLQFFITKKQDLVPRFKNFMKRIRASVAQDEVAAASGHKMAKKRKHRDGSSSVSSSSDSEAEDWRVRGERNRRSKKPNWEERLWDRNRETPIDTTANRDSLLQYTNTLIFKLKPAVEDSLFASTQCPTYYKNTYRNCNDMREFPHIASTINSLCQTIDADPNKGKKAMKTLKRNLLVFLDWLQILEDAKTNLSNLNAVLYLLGCELPFFFWNFVLDTVCGGGGGDAAAAAADKFMLLASEAIHRVMIQNPEILSMALECKLTSAMIQTSRAQFNILFEILELDYDESYRYLSNSRRNVYAHIHSPEHHIEDIRPSLQNEMDTYNGDGSHP